MNTENYINQNEPKDMEEYSDYPFAMEIVNGEIINLSSSLQRKIRMKILDKLHISPVDLVQFLEEGSEDECYEILNKVGAEALVEILGFDCSSELFTDEGISFLESVYGWEAKELLDDLGFDLQEDINEGSHGHGSYGVIFISQ